MRNKYNTGQFRGSFSPQHEWVYGFYYEDHQGNSLIKMYDGTDDLGDIVYKECPVDKISLGELTPFKDNKGVEIYEGDILSDWTEVDGEMLQSKMQVFWCSKVGAWKLDNSYNQDKSSGDLLSDELHDFNYEVTGNIYNKHL